MSNRRQFLFGAGTVTAALLGIGTSNTMAQNAAPEGLYFTGVFPEAEYLVIENRGESSIDLTHYYINFERRDEYDQIRQFGRDGQVAAGSDLRLEPGESLTIATGAERVSDADVTFDYEGAVINDETPDSFAILLPDGETVVAQADKNPSPPPTDTPTSTATPDEGTTATEADAPTTRTTTTEASTPTETATAEDTSTAEPTTTAEPTQTATAEPTETPDGTTTEMPEGVDVDDGC